MRFCTWIVLFFASLNVSAQEFSGNWREYFVSDKGENFYDIPNPGMAMRIEDRFSKRGESNVLIFNTVLNLKEPMQVGKAVVKSLVWSKYFNCDSGASSSTGAYAYSEKFGKGSLVNSESYSELDWVKFPAEDAGFVKLLKASCATNGKK